MAITLRRSKRSGSRKRRLRMFLFGAGQAFVIFPAKRDVAVPSYTDQHRDEAALRGDWNVIGVDVRRAMRKRRSDDPRT